MTDHSVEGERVDSESNSGESQSNLSSNEGQIVEKKSTTGGEAATKDSQNSQIGNSENLYTLSTEELEFNEIKALAAGEISDEFTYRLPTEVELQYAAKATIITQDKDGIESTMILDYGNIKSSVRHPDGKNKGELVGLFNISRGDYKGLPGESETAAPTEPVDTRAPNALGVAGCYGCVFQITLDEYRILPAYYYADQNPCRTDTAYDSNYDKSSPLSSKCRVILGGSFKTPINVLRSFLKDDECADNVGFRVAAAAA